MLDNTRTQTAAPPTGRIQIGGLEIPLPRWSVCALAFLLVTAVSLQMLGTHILPLYKSLFPAQQEEYERHWHEEAASSKEVFDDQRGRLAITYYESDGCITVERDQQLQWVLDPRNSAPPPDSLLTAFGGVAAAGFAFSPQPPARQTPARQPAASIASTTGECLDPHPGSFDTKHGERKDCWVKVWRTWSDGCTQYQWFNSCQGSWNSTQHWTRCVH